MLGNLLASAKFKEKLEPTDIKVTMQRMDNTSIKLS